MKKNLSLGRTLSKEEQTKIMGGSVQFGPGCSTGDSCKYYENSTTGYVNGTCGRNSSNQCVCKSANSSVVWSACEELAV